CTSRRRQAHFFLRIAQEESYAALEHVERVLDVVVIVPGHLLARPDLQLGDPEARALGVPGPPLDLVEMARVLHSLAFDRFHGAPPSTRSAPRPAGPPPRHGPPRPLPPAGGGTGRPPGGQG